MSGTRARGMPRKARRERLLALLGANPFLTDEELARLLGVSLPTVRLDRAELGVPELRQRTHRLARAAYRSLRSLSQGELVGELVELVLGERARSRLDTAPHDGFARTGIVRGHHLFAQANSLAVAVVDAELALTGSARVRFLRPVRVGESVLATARVERRWGRAHRVRVDSRVGGEPVLAGSFLVVAGEVARGRASGEAGNSGLL